SWMQLFNEADLYGMQGLVYRTLAEHEPGAAGIAESHAKKALRMREGGRQRSQIFDHISIASACFIGGDPEQADRYARLALLTIEQNSSHRTWDRLREMYRLTGRYSTTPAIRELREELQQVMPKSGAGKGGAGLKGSGSIARSAAV
ncbi:hypothetical protein ABZ554_40070, partial [Streptomyces sp. NPDC020125]